MISASDTNELTTRWQRRKKQRPDEILKAALDCFVEYGFSATRLDEIARRAGISKGTLYLYFSGKEEIFKSVVRQEIVSSIVHEEKILANENVPAAESLKQFYRFISKEVIPSKISAIPKLILAEAGNFPEVVRFYHSEVISRGLKLLSKIIRRGIRSGEFRKVEVEQVVYSLISPLIFAVMWKHSIEPHAKSKLDADRLLKHHLELILHGLYKPSGGL